MTTKVTVDPANHDIVVTVSEGETVTSETLKAISPARDYWVYGDRVLMISEAAEEATHG